MPMAPALGVWLSEPSSVLPGLPKRSRWTGWLTPLPGPAVPDAEPLAGAAQEQVIVGVLVVLLDEVVVDVLGGQFGLDAVEAHRLQLQHDQRAGGVLGQGLVDADADLLAGLHPPFDQVRLDEFLGDIEAHGQLLPYAAACVTWDYRLTQGGGKWRITATPLPLPWAEFLRPFGAVDNGRAAAEPLTHSRGSAVPHLTIQSSGNGYPR